MNNKPAKILTFFVLVLLVLGISYISKRQKVEVTVSSSYPQTSIVIPNPNLPLTAELVEDPSFVPDEVSSPSLMLRIVKEDGSLYKQIKLPRATKVIYGADSGHVYVGGEKPNIQQNIFIVGVDTGIVEQYYFGSKGDAPGAQEISFSDNARFMAYIDKAEHPPNAETLYVYDFKTKNTEEIVTSPDLTASDFHWKGSILIYDFLGEQSIDLGARADSQPYTEIASSLFTKELDREIAENGGVSSYFIHKIEFVGLKKTAGEPEKFWFQPDDTDEAFIVTIKYSVKLDSSATEQQHSWWVAGNGDYRPDGWVWGKYLFVTIDKNSSGYYIKNMGTGP